MSHDTIEARRLLLGRHIGDITKRVGQNLPWVHAPFLVGITIAACADRGPTQVDERTGEWSPLLVNCPDRGGGPAPHDSIPWTGGYIWPRLHEGASWSQQGLIAYADNGFECVIERADGSALFDPELRGIWIIDPNSGVKKRVVDRGRDPSWSPEGSHIAFEYSYQIYVVEIATGNITRLTDVQRNYHPAWSPEGAWIAYDSNAGGFYDVWLVCSDGTNRHILDPPEPNGRRTPAWHPLGRRILLSSWGDSHNQEIYEISLDDAAVRLVAQRLEFEFDRDPTYSADGESIAFESMDSDVIDIHAFQIWTMLSDGTDQRQLTVCGGDDPSWSPDGTMIVYTKYLDNGSPENGVLWLIDVRNRTEKQLTFHPPCDQWPP